MNWKRIFPVATILMRGQRDVFDVAKIQNPFHLYITHSTFVLYSNCGTAISTQCVCVCWENGMRRIWICWTSFGAFIWLAKIELKPIDVMLNVLSSSLNHLYLLSQVNNEWIFGIENIHKFCIKASPGSHSEYTHTHISHRGSSSLFLWRYTYIHFLPHTYFSMGLGLFFINTKRNNITCVCVCMR